MTKNLSEYAKHYAKKGFYVLPLSQDKTPLIKFANHPALTEDEIENVWNKYPYAQIGLRTVQFFVVDIDNEIGHGTDGFKSIKGIDLNETLSQTTASGGKQYFYKKPKDISLSQNIGILDGVDIKAHINNYVMVAPSERKDVAYKWDNHLPMNEPSKDIINLIKQSKPTKKGITLNFNGGIRIKKYTGKLIDEMVTGTSTGTRNDWLTRMTAKLLFSGAELENIYYMLLVINSNFIDEPLEESEVNKIFNSMVNKDGGQWKNYPKK